MRLNQTVDSTTARIHVAGDLEYGRTDALVDTVAALLSAHPDLTAVHLDFAGLAFCDSVGLSALLQVRRLTSTAGARLHLDNRPGHLDRVLELTGVLDHLTAAPSHEKTEIG